jgi:drug/metabolite transporter (DMT)-like permease
VFRIDREWLARHPEGVAIGLVLWTVAIWGSTPQVTAVGADHAQPFTLTMLRALPTGLLLLAAMPLLRFRFPRGRTAWLFTAASGLLMVGVFLGGFTEGVSRAGPGPAIVMSSTSPLWVAILSRVVHKERIALRTAGGLLIGFLGVLLVFSSQLNSSSSAGNTVIGLACALAAALGWAVGTLIVKEHLTRQPDTDLLGVVAGQYLIGGVVLLVLSSLIEGSGGAQWSSVDLWLSVAFITIVGSAIATVAYFAALKVISATRVTAWSFLSPVVAIVIGLGLGTVPSPLVFVGMGITIVGVFIVNLRKTTSPDSVGELAETAELGAMLDSVAAPVPAVTS